MVMNVQPIKEAGSLDELKTLIPDGAIEKSKEKILADWGVKKFIDKFQEAIDDEMIDRGLPVLGEYIYARENYRQYKPELMLYRNNFYAEYDIRKEFLDKKEHAHQRRKLDLTTVSVENRRASLDEFDQSDIGRINALGKAIEFLNNFKVGKNTAGFWLVGNHGIGKSYLMAALARAVNEKGASVTMIDLNEFITNLKADMGQDSNRMEKKLNKLEYVDVLIIDDIGAEFSSDWVLDEVVYRILNSRHKYDKATCFTSNLTKGQYIQSIRDTPSKGGPNHSVARARRIATRIDALATEVQSSGQNRRKVLN